MRASIDIQRVLEDWQNHAANDLKKRRLIKARALAALSFEEYLKIEENQVKIPN